MDSWILSKEDREYLISQGIDLEEFKKYEYLFERGNVPLKIIRPCTVGDGIESLTEEEKERYTEIYEVESSKGRFSVFIPASGASTRMFQSLCEILLDHSIRNIEDIKKQCFENQRFCKALEVFKNVEKLPFWNDLKKWGENNGIDVESLIQKGPIRNLVKAILQKNGLGLGNLPKALLPFHRYGGEVKTAFEEHIWEGAEYLCDSKNTCRFHFTIPKEYEKSFYQEASRLKRLFLENKGVYLDITFSIQHPSTHKPSVDESNNLVRDEKGRPLLRPGGHGALLKNLQEFGGDLVFIKNIDNVSTLEVRKVVVLWKKILGGMLVSMEGDFNYALETLGKEAEKGIEVSEEICKKWKQNLPPYYQELSLAEKVSFWTSFLDRPKRICGMVRNVDHPGGGPFWVEERDGEVRRQIVEKAQLNSKDPVQKALWDASTHFNPVDLVCAIRKRDRRPYNLSIFVDPDAYIITEKHHFNKKLRILENPGLWNGSMAGWITLFVEVPFETFHPVKEITDLLKKFTR